MLTMEFLQQADDRFEDEIPPALESNGNWSGNAAGKRRSETSVYEQR